MMLKKFLKGMACLGAALAVGVISKCHAEKIFIKISNAPQEIRTAKKAERENSRNCIPKEWQDLIIEEEGIAPEQDYCLIEVFLEGRNNSGNVVLKKIMKSVMCKDCFEYDKRNKGIQYLGEDTRGNGIIDWSKDFTVPAEKYNAAIEAIKKFPATDRQNCHFQCGRKGARPVADPDEDMVKHWDDLLSLVGVHMSWS